VLCLLAYWLEVSTKPAILSQISLVFLSLRANAEMVLTFQVGNTRVLSTPSHLNDSKLDPLALDVEVKLII
jgi:hypothetical protein